MASGIENDPGVGRLVHSMRRWSRSVMSRMGQGLVEQDRRALDPLTVNYAAWRAAKRAVRDWPGYREAPNRLVVLVSPEDWEDYWGIDTARKAEGIASYVQSRVAGRGYWMSGDAQVEVVEDDAIYIGEVEVECHFVEPRDKDEVDLTMDLSLQGGGPAGVPLDEAGYDDDPDEVGSDAGEVWEGPLIEEDAPEDDGLPDVSSTLRRVEATEASIAWLVDDGGFCLEVRPGDCLGAVRLGDHVPEEVNVRLDAAGFPYAEVKQCTIDVVDGQWAVTNHAGCGTKLVTVEGERLMLGEPVPFPLADGDVIFMGPQRPLRFETEYE